MDDKYGLTALTYLLILLIFSPMLPASMFASPLSGSINQTEIVDSFNMTGDNMNSLSEQVNFIEKIALTLFIPVAIEGVPLYLGLLLQIINIMGAIIGGIYIYGLIRGIS